MPEKTALVPLLVRLEPVYPATKSTYEIAAMKYLDKRGIFFGAAQRDRIVDDPQRSDNRVIGEIVMYMLPNTYALAGPVENPLPMSELRAVQDTVRKVNEGLKTRSSSSPEK